MSAIFASLLAVLGPLIGQALQALLQMLIDKWKAKPATAAILADANTPEKLHAAVPRLRELVASDFDGPLNWWKRRQFNRLMDSMQKKPVTDAVFDHMVMTGAVQGEPTGVAFIDVLDAVQ